MATSTKRTVKATVTLTEGSFTSEKHGDAIIAQIASTNVPGGVPEDFIAVPDDEDSKKVTFLGVRHIVKVESEIVEGEAYKPAELEGLFCDPKATPPTPPSPSPEPEAGE